MICPRCSYDNLEGCKFCTECGARLIAPANTPDNTERARPEPQNFMNTPPIQQERSETNPPDYGYGTSAGWKAGPDMMQQNSFQQQKAGPLMIAAAIAFSLYLLLSLTSSDRNPVGGLLYILAAKNEGLETIIYLIDELVYMLSLYLDASDTVINIILLVPNALILAGVWLIALNNRFSPEYRLGFSIIRVVSLIREILTLAGCLIGLFVLGGILEGDAAWILLVPVIVAAVTIYYYMLLFRTLKIGIPDTLGGSRENVSLVFTIIVMCQGISSALDLSSADRLLEGVTLILFAVIMIKYRLDYSTGMTDALNGLPEPRSNTPAYQYGYDVGHSQSEWNQKFRG